MSKTTSSIIQNSSKHVNEMSHMTQSWLPLVTNTILHEFRLSAIEYFVSSYRQSINPRFTVQFILEVANFILSKIRWLLMKLLCYLQIQGIAIGINFASNLDYIIIGLRRNCQKQNQSYKSSLFQSLISLKKIGKDF